VNYPVPAKKGFWWVTAGAAVAVLLTALLGNWQLGRAAEKIALQAAIDQKQKLPPLANADIISAAGPADLVHHAAVLRGIWRGEHTVFLDNRQMAGKVGLFVMTPLQLADSQTSVMVQRGWVPRNFLERDRLPTVATPTGEVAVQVRMAPPPSKLFDFKGGDNGALRQNLDLVDFARTTGIALRTDVGAIETEARHDGLARNWPAFNTGVDKHYGYAFQWFGLSALLLILYVWFQFIQPRRARHRG
jgi:surfeit locus 1 family protein